MCLKNNHLNTPVLFTFCIFEKILDNGLFKSKLELSKAIGMNETFVGDLVNTVNMDARRKTG
jgi:hypothetical protein